jgi:histidinol-phosphate aminotransferase
MNKFLDGLPILTESGVNGYDLSRNQNHVERKTNVLDIPKYYDERNYPSEIPLRMELARIYGVHIDQVIIGNGSTDILNVCARACLSHGKFAMFETPSYMPIKQIIEKTGATHSEIAGDVRFIVNPNNPTGEFYSPSEQSYDYEVVVVDEAYMDYHPERESFVSWVNKVDNLIVVRTFSKFFGLAGLRIGYAIASKKISEYLRKVQNPYPISGISSIAAINALYDFDHQRETLALTGECLYYLTNGLDKLGVERLQPCGNFVSAKIPKVEGFQTRSLGAYSGLEGWERISCAKIEVIDSFLKELEKKI